MHYMLWNSSQIQNEASIDLKVPRKLTFKDQSIVFIFKAYKN